MIPAAPLPVHTGPAFSTVSAQEIVFVALAVVVLASGLLVVTTRTVVHAALWLVVTLGGLAGCYLLLTAEFLAWVQVLVYVGAVVVLLLFGAMLTRAPLGRGREDLDSGNRPAAVVVGLGAAATMVTLLAQGFRNAYIDLDRVAGTGGAQQTGAAIFRSYVLPFEVASVLLLAALIGAIVLTRRDDGAGTNGGGAADRDAPVPSAVPEVRA